MRHRRLRRALPDVCEHLAHLMAAGIPLVDALQVQTFRHGSAAAQLVEAAGLALHTGRTLVTAWTDSAPPLLQLLLSVGERSGRLAEMMAAWVVHVRGREAWRRRWTRSLSYPTLVLFACVSLAVFISRFVLPQFTRMYAELGIIQPPATRAMERGLSWAPQMLMVCFALLFALSALVMMGATRKPYWWSQVRRRLPGWRWLRMARTRTLCQLLSMLLGSGVPIIEALAELKAAGSGWVRRTVEPVHARILTGASLSNAFNADTWDPVLQTLLAVAEQTGDVAEALTRAEVALRLALEREVEAALRFVEPAAVLLLGTIVACTMFLLFVPMYDLINSTTASGFRSG